MPVTPSPLGLIRFEKAIVTKKPGKCFFCGAATTPGTDYAALDGKWIAVCSLHANSVVEQCKAMLLLIQADAATFGLTADDLAKVNELAPTNLPAVLGGTCDIPTAIAAAIKLSDALRAVRAHQPVTAAPVRSNRYEGKCGTCATTVAEGSGRIEKVNNKWVTFHLDGQCNTTTTAAPVATVPEGRYALNTDEGVKFYRVEHGKAGSRWDGYVFVSAQASEALHPIRNRQHRQAILDAIAVDPHAATVLYGIELGVCGRCGITLTSEYRLTGIGPVCGSKAW
jgi:hypothetical protein